MLIDDHVHVTTSRTTRRKDGETYCTPSKLIEMMDGLGVDKAVLLPRVSPECGARVVTVEDVLEICAVYPDRFIPYCNLDPRWDTNDANADLSRYLRFYKEAGCKGVGEVVPNLPFDDPMMENLFAHCQDFEMPVMFHVAPKLGGAYGIMDDPGLPRLEKALAKFPDLLFIGHSQPFWAEIGGDLDPAQRNTYPKGPVVAGGRLVELFERYPNLYGDMSAGSGFNAISRDPQFGFEFMERFQDRLLFGTDICCPKDKPQLPAYLRDQHEKGSISTQVFEKIGWRNADRILGLGLAAG